MNLCEMLDVYIRGNEDLPEKSKALSEYKKLVQKEAPELLGIDISILYLHLKDIEEIFRQNLPEANIGVFNYIPLERTHE